MTVLGQICLLTGLLATGYSAFAAITWTANGHPTGARRATWAACVGLAALTAVMIILAIALVTKDFRFNYVVEYSSRLLPWHYSLSAIWVGQGGSLLLWTWLLTVLAILFRMTAGRQVSPHRMRAFGIAMAYVFFLVAVMVFAADPVRPSLTQHDEGVGLSPLLQHPAMLIHPPVVFLGYAAWTIPFALGLATLIWRNPDANWLAVARRWTLFAWTVLGVGIILGGNWAYEELGWGGYWAWDPVENGSLLPWLTGTALIHCLIAWQMRGMLKKSALAFATATFLLCNFATFLTRSGIFSSLHAFSQSSIGWMFLALMVTGTVVCLGLLVYRRNDCRAERVLTSLWSREAMITLSNVGLVVLSVVTFCGTLMVPLSDFLLGKKLVVGMAFFNYALIPVGLLLLSSSAATPLLRWGGRPSERQRRLLTLAICLGLLASVAGVVGGAGHPLTVVVLGGAGFAVATFAGALWLDLQQHRFKFGHFDVLATLRGRRQQYAGYIMHLGFACLAVGIAGSSLGSARHEVVMREGETTSWSGYTFQLAAMRQSHDAEKIVADVELLVSRRGRTICKLYPAQHMHRHQREWTTEVAIHSNWSRDIYTILHGTADARQADLTLVINPLTRWIWVGAWLFVFGTCGRLWPKRPSPRPPQKIARPKFLRHSGRRAVTTDAS